MVAAGIELGLTPEDANQLSIQTIYGAATMLRDSGKHQQPCAKMLQVQMEQLLLHLKL